MFTIRTAQKVRLIVYDMKIYNSILPSLVLIYIYTVKDKKVKLPLKTYEGVL